MAKKTNTQVTAPITPFAFPGNTQIDRIGRYLVSGKSITQDIALRQFKCTRLSAMIFSLRKKHFMNVVKTTVKSKEGRPVAKYSLDLTAPTLIQYVPKQYEYNKQVAKKELSEQELAIVKYLQAGHRISSLVAYPQFGTCRRLSARIFNIRKHGYVIKSERKRSKNKKVYAEYWM